MARRPKAKHVSRRQLLIGGGAGVGLLLAWAAWPRSYAPNLRAAEGETILNGFVKIGSDGRVVIAVPQSELGQGVYTSLAQIFADELGADWRTVSVEPSPISPIYANRLLAADLAADDWPSMLEGVGRRIAGEQATRTSLMVTGYSTSVRAFEATLREAGAAARAVLSKAAARRWEVDWEELEAREGFVIYGEQKLSFGELAEAAAGEEVQGDLALRGGDEGRLVGQALPRIDLPSKVDGTAQFAGDIRLPGMVYGSVRQGPIGKSRLVSIQGDAARRIPGVIALLESPRWAGAVATNWWAANKAIEAMSPRFETDGGFVDSASVDGVLVSALGQSGSRLIEMGDPDGLLTGTNVFRSHYSAWVAPNAPPETLTATARITGDRVEIWAPAQAPTQARRAAARAAGVHEDRVTLYRTMIGGGYGRKLETRAIEQAVVMATKVKRPVQLTWSRIEETMQDTFRPPARAELAARLGEGGVVVGWGARIAAPSTQNETAGRLYDGSAGAADEVEAAAVEGARPPYSIPSIAVDHHPAAVGIPTGLWRSRAHSYTAFFTECFVDELARRTNIEPLSFRMQMLGDNPRLAQVLSMAAALAGWDGAPPGSTKGLAAHSAFGSHVALVVEIEIAANQAILVRRATCAVDCGRIINPEIVRQQVEGGIIHGIAGATGTRIPFERGLAGAKGYRDLGLPILATSPEIMVELVPSDEEPGGVTELAVPPVGPAIANAMFALTGRRLRNLPLTAGQTE
jgi:isoquinoline 1-oxidoreductase beta subunit